MEANKFVTKYGLNSFKAAMMCPQFNRYEYAILYFDEVDFSNDLIEKHKNYMFKTSEIKRLVESHELVEKHGGLISARKYIKFLRSSVDIGLYYGLDDVDYKTEIPLIEQAIADVESCMEPSK